MLNRRQVINIAISGDIDEKTLKVLSDEIREDILTLKGISQAQVSSLRPYEISVEVSERDLRRYGLTFDEVVLAIRRSSLDLPGGALKTEGGEVLLRTKGQAYSTRDFEDIILRTRADGTRLTIGDIARVIDGFAETDQSARFDGKPAALIQVFRVGDEDAIHVASQVRGYVHERRQRMPEGVELTIWSDDSRVLRSRINLLMRNGRSGMILVLIVLALFLKFRLAIWVAMGIPFSFLGALWIMPQFGVSVNMISLFAFILVIGILVDDAIVVGESIFTEFELGKTKSQAATDGVKRVAVPVVFAVLTTIAAFWPLLSVEGVIGKIMRLIPIVVILTLLFSLFESLFILPSHLAHLHLTSEVSTRGIPALWKRFQTKFTDLFQTFVDRAYRPSLELCLRNRYATVAAGIAILLLTVGMVAGGWIKFVFFPKIDADNVTAELTMPLGTPAEVTRKAVMRLEETAHALEEEFGEEHHIIRHILTSVGEQPARNESRGPGAQQAFFTGAPISIQLASANKDALRHAAEKLKEKITDYSGVYDVTDSFRQGKQEVKLSITPEAESLGLALADLGRQVRQAFYGEEAQRIQRGRDEVKVMVRYPADERRSLTNLETKRIRLSSGVEVPFSVAADAHIGRGYSFIERTDRQRTLDVTSEIDEGKSNANEIIEDLKLNVLPKLLADYPEIRYSFEGERRDQQEALGSLKRGFILALLVIYALLAIPFKSYLQPVIVMGIIPFGIVGAIWGHILMRLDLTILSMFGIVALAGVVVNDSLVMVDFINRTRNKGTPLMQAIQEAGVARFRAIILTSLTTFAGLSPLLLERSLQARFLIPMAASLAFGILFATFITLLLVPVSYMILEDIKNF
ncbi:MAG: efflux RND transporter permease subunit [bacterium]